MPEAPSALTAAAVHRLQVIRNDNKGVAAATTALPTAEHQTNIARMAVVEPQAEQDAHAQQGVVAAVDDRPPPSPEIEAACARIREVIKAKRPASEDKLVDAKPREMALEAGQEMSSGVEQRAALVREGYAGIQQAPHGTAETTPVRATLPSPQAQTVPVNTNAGAPDALRRDDVSLDADVAAQRQQIQTAGMNTEAGQLVQDGPIGDARRGIADLQQAAQQEPQKVLAEQAAAIAHAQGDMHALQAAAEKALAAARAGTVTQLGQHTAGVKGGEEQQRAAAGVQMHAVFSRAQQDVDKLLQPLSTKAVARWDAGVAQLSTSFEASLAGVKAKVAERHEGVTGKLVSLWDAATGMPAWVVADYDRAEAMFADGATSLITDISRDVNAVIESCKKLIQLAREELDAIARSLPASLQAWAHSEAAQLGTQLDQLGEQVVHTQHSLDHELTTRANGAVQTVRERVSELREQAKGLLGKIADALVEFAKDPARAIINGLLRILSIPPPSFWALVDKIGKVISQIAADPMKFAKTLLSGVGQGFQQFFHNLPTHLGHALFQWLFSKLGEAGVAMPTDWSMRSILTLVLEIMGISWARIKLLIAKHIGDKNAALLDQAIQLISTLMAKGPQGIYEMIADQLNPATIIDAIKDAAIQYVIQAITTRVTARLLMLFNPAGAILQAIEAIYRVIKWVVQNAAQIFTLVESLVNGVAQVVAGNVSGVAGLVENALAGLIGPVINFLADYFGLGGIPDAIKNVILGLQAKVENVLDRVIGFLVTKAKALWEAIKNRVKGKNTTGDQDHSIGKDQKTGSEAVGERIPFSSEDESHSLYVQVSGASATLMVASSPMTAAAWLRKQEQRLPELGAEETQKSARDAIRAADGLIGKADKEADAVAAANAASAAPPAGAAAAAPGAASELNTQLKTDEEALAAALQNVLKAFGVGKPIACLDQVTLVKPFVAKERPASGRKLAMTRDELCRQVKIQEDALNGLMVAQWRANWKRFHGSPDDASEVEGRADEAQASRDREAAISEERQKVIDQWMQNNPGKSAEEATGFVRRLFTKNPGDRSYPFMHKSLVDNGVVYVNAAYGKSILHTADQVVGGGSATAGLGGSRENFSIGAQWDRGGRAEDLKTQLEAARKKAGEKVGAAEVDKFKLNVKLHVING